MDVDDGFRALWPTLLLERRLPDTEHADAALAALLLEMDGARDSLTTDYRASNLFDVAHPAIAWLRQCVRRSVLDYLARQGIARQVDWRAHGWANVNRRGDYHNLHNHPHSYLSGTYYVAVPEQPRALAGRADLDPGAISFFDPRGHANMGAIAGDGQVDPEYRVLPEAGLMLLWPAFLMHAVHPNFADAPRLSISFNVLVRRGPEDTPGQP